MKGPFFNVFAAGVFLLFLSFSANAQIFVQPGGLRTKADLDCMKAKVEPKNIRRLMAGICWLPMVCHKIHILRDHIQISVGREIASKLQKMLMLLIWILCLDIYRRTTYDACAARICNALANTVNVASGELFQLPINNFVQAAEFLRLYPGWKASDFTKFKNMALTFFIRLAIVLLEIVRTLPVGIVRNMHLLWESVSCATIL